MAEERKPLTGILPSGSGGGDDILDLFDSTEAADEFGPLPRGVYVAIAVKGEQKTARTGTPNYTVEFRVIEGEHTGRRLWRPWFLTEAAMQYTRRDLKKFGIDSKEKLLAPFPANRMVFKLTVVVRTNNDGIEMNEIRNLELLRLVEPEVDPYAPESEGGIVG